MTTIVAPFRPWLDLLRATGIVLLLAGLALLLAACGGGSDADLPAPTGPALTQPIDQSVAVGGTATFDVAVSGGTGATFQWQQASGASWADIAGATAASLVIADAAPAQDGSTYRVVVVVAGQTLISNPATLTVTALAVAPAITTPPAGVSVVEPATATFSVTASGTATLAYRWQRLASGTWTDIAGASAASYTTPATTRAADDGAQFRVVVSNAVGSATSSAATLSVAQAPAAPAFLTQPADATVAAPATASFTVSVAGTPTPTLQWQQSTDGGATWSDVSAGTGATAATYTTPATTVGMSGTRYRVVAGNGIGAAITSNAALLTVNAAAVAPAIVTPPANRTVTEPASASFSVAATGTTPAYQWQRLAGSTWNNINGATAATYATPATVRANDNGAQFRVVVTNGAGSVTSAPATLTVLAAVSKAWSAPQVLRSGGGNTNSFAQVAMDASGNATVVWVQELGPTNGARDLWSERYLVGSGWSAAEVIDSNPNEISGQPLMGVDAAGNALAVWVQSDGAASSIWANRYVAGSGWGVAALIETANTAAQSPNIAVGRDGNAIALWSQNDGTRYNLWSSRYTVGSGWGTPEMIETENAGSAGQAYTAQIAIDASGNGLAVWAQVNGSRRDLWSNRYTAGTGWGTAELLETDDAGNVSSSSVAFDAAGNAMVVWDQSDGTRANVWARRHVAGTGWEPAQLIETDNAGTSGAQDPYVAVDGSGNAIAVWTQRNAAGRNFIQYNRYTAGVGWGTHGTVAESPVGSVSSARFAFDGNGDALAVWNSTNGTASLVAFGRYTVAGGWTQIGGAGGSFAQAVGPRIAVDAAGNAIAVWLQNAEVAGNSGDYSVWAARYQ